MAATVQISADAMPPGLRPEFYVRFGSYFHWDQGDEGCIPFIVTNSGVLVRFMDGMVETAESWCDIGDPDWHAPTPDCEVA